MLVSGNEPIHLTKENSAFVSRSEGTCDCKVSLIRIGTSLGTRYPSPIGAERVSVSGSTNDPQISDAEKVLIGYK